MRLKDTSRAEKSHHPVSSLNQSSSWDDATLVSRALEGDPFAENAIFRQHAPYLYNLAARLTQRMSNSDDVVQDTFLVAFRKLETLDNPEALRPWLIRILISQVKKNFRIKRLRAFFGMDSVKEDATLSLLAVHDTRPDLRIELKEIDDVLQRIPPEWRITWMLHRIEGMSIHETSRAVKRSTATVKRYVNAVDVTIQSKRSGAK